MATTLKDIAAAAGVSIGTVQRALKNRDRINPQVAEHIRQLAKEMNYQLNRIASGLVNKSRQHQIAVIFHVKPNDFWNEVLRGIRRAEKEVKDYGISIRIYFGQDFDVQTQLSLINQALAEGASALVICPINSPLVAKRIRELHKEQFPIVFLNTYINRLPVLSSIHCNYYRSGRIAGMLINRLSGGSGQVMAFLPSSSMLGNNYRNLGILDYFQTVPGSLRLDGIIQLSNDARSDLELISRELQLHEDVAYIIYNGDAKVCISAMEQLARPFTSVFFDLSEDTRTALLDGRIDAVITQAPEDQGYRAINVLLQYLVFQTEPEKEVIMESNILFKECID